MTGGFRGLGFPNPESRVGLGIDCVVLKVIATGQRQLQARAQRHPEVRVAGLEPLHDDGGRVARRGVIVVVIVAVVRGRGRSS